MRKSSMTIAMALVIGSAGTAVAQQPPTQQAPAAGEHRGHDGAKGQRGERGARGERGERRGPQAFLLRGITLTDAQKAQLEQVIARKKPTEAERKQLQAQREEMRALRQKGDTAALRTKFAALRARMEQERDRDLAAIRGVLTAEQQKQFDANLADAKKRQAERGERRGGARRGR